MLSAGLHQVYGDTYPIREFYDGDHIDELLRIGKFHAVIALNDNGEVVAQMSTVLEQTGDVTADGSALMVDRRYRGQGVVANLGAKMVEVYSALKLSGLHLYALALHDLVQNQSGNAGATVTGVLPAWFSQRARVDGYDYPEGKRIGAVCLYMPLAELPRRQCYLPSRYRSVMEGLYGALKAPRDLSPADLNFQIRYNSLLRHEVKKENGLSRLIVDSAGGDFEQRLNELGTKTDTELLLLDLSLSDPALERAAGIAREQGFFFGGLMVDRCGADRLRLQRYDPALACPEAMVLASDEARRLRDFILEDQ